MDFYSNDKLLCYVPDNAMVGDEVYYNNITYIITKRCITAHNMYSQYSTLYCKGKPKFEKMYRLGYQLLSIFNFNLFECASDSYWDDRFNTILNDPKLYPTGLLMVEFDLIDCNLTKEKAKEIAIYITNHYTVDDTH